MRRCDGRDWSCELFVVAVCPFPSMRVAVSVLGVSPLSMESVQDEGMGIVIVDLKYLFSGQKQQD